MSFAMTNPPETPLAPAENGTCGAKDQTSAPRKMTGLFSQLTPEQREFAMNYKGPTNLGDPAFLIKNTRAGSR